MSCVQRWLVAFRTGASKFPLCAGLTSDNVVEQAASQRDCGRAQEELAATQEKLAAYKTDMEELQTQFAADFGAGHSGSASTALHKQMQEKLRELAALRETAEAAETQLRLRPAVSVEAAMVEKALRWELKEERSSRVRGEDDVADLRRQIASLKEQVRVTSIYVLIVAERNFDCHVRDVAWATGRI